MTKPRREQVGPGGDPIVPPTHPTDAGQWDSTDSAGVNPPAEQVNGGVVLDCGWGRLVFGQTFPTPFEAADVLRAEALGQRDICMYLPDPHVLVARLAGELFIDPSYTYRLELPAELPDDRPAGLTVRALRDEADAEAVNGIYARNRMITAPLETLAANASTPTFEHLIAADSTGRIVGTVTGVDHVAAFGDEQRGTSLWCLTVDGQLAPPGTGVTLITELARRFAARGRAHIDLSVLADNSGAIRLYERLGFRREAVLCVKRKNTINEMLFTGVSPDGYDELNPYARIIADEARRRGITVEVIDPSWGELRLTYGGRSLVTRESLSELTTAIAMSRCDDKRVTRRVLSAAGLRVPRAHTASYDEHDEEFLRRNGSLVVKPARGEQGAGISIGVTTQEQLQAAITEARRYCPDVLLEEYVEGEDLRVVVIDDEVVAAAIRCPAAVVGTGRHSVRTLIERQSKRRAAATHGESRIPMDAVTEQIVRDAGYTMDDVLPEGRELRVRRTANLHTGGTIHDVTANLHPAIVDASICAARALDIPVTGLDLLVPDPARPEHVFIEANERPGLANHEPQPTAEKFVDLLFPGTTSIPRHWEPSGVISQHSRVEAPVGRG
jgi:GNAT-family acetyltransferase (TIGR03103 family)